MINGRKLWNQTLLNVRLLFLETKQLLNPWDVEKFAFFFYISWNLLCVVIFCQLNFKTQKTQQLGKDTWSSFQLELFFIRTAENGRHWSKPLRVRPSVSVFGQQFHNCWMWQLECPSQLLPPLLWEQCWEALPLADVGLWLFQAAEGKTKKQLYSTGSIIGHMVPKFPKRKQNKITVDVIWFFWCVSKGSVCKGNQSLFSWDREEWLGRNFVSIRLWLKFCLGFPLVMMENKTQH